MDTTPTAGVSLRRALIGPFTTTSLGAAAIHFGVTSVHFQEWWAFGLFMAGVGWFQALWPIAYVLRPSVRLALLAAFVNLATAVVWAWSRYSGLPFGPGAGTPQPAGVADVLATAFELVLVVGLFATSIAPVRRETVQQRVADSTWIAWSAAIALLVAATTSVALTVAMGSMP